MRAELLHHKSKWTKQTTRRIFDEKRRNMTELGRIYVIFGITKVSKRTSAAARTIPGIHDRDGCACDWRREKAGLSPPKLDTTADLKRLAQVTGPNQSERRRAPKRVTDVGIFTYFRPAGDQVNWPRPWAILRCREFQSIPISFDQKKQQRSVINTSKGGNIERDGRHRHRHGLVIPGGAFPDALRKRGVVKS